MEQKLKTSKGVIEQNDTKIKNLQNEMSQKLKRQPLPKRKKLLQLSKKVLKQQIQKLQKKNQKQLKRKKRKKMKKGSQQQLKE